MSDPALWNQKLIHELTGIYPSAPTIEGIQEATVTKVGTDKIQMAGQPAVTMHVVWFNLPNTHGPGPGFGPAAYQPVPGWTPSVGDPCLICVVGNGTGRPYVVSFPTAVPT